MKTVKTFDPSPESVEASTRVDRAWISGLRARYLNAGEPPTAVLEHRLDPGLVAHLRRILRKLQAAEAAAPEAPSLERADPPSATRPLADLFAEREAFTAFPNGGIGEARYFVDEERGKLYTETHLVLRRPGAHSREGAQRLLEELRGTLTRDWSAYLHSDRSSAPAKLIDWTAQADGSFRYVWMPSGKPLVQIKERLVPVAPTDPHDSLELRITLKPRFPLLPLPSFKGPIGVYGKIVEPRPGEYAVQIDWRFEGIEPNSRLLAFAFRSAATNHPKTNLEAAVQAHLSTEAAQWRALIDYLGLEQVQASGGER
jgi:hypothetical protein